MSQSEQRPPRRTTPRYGGYVGLLALLIIALITINTIVTKPNGVKGLAPGERVPPFAVPLALGNLNGDADTATRANEGAAGRVPACEERGTQILNICELYEGAPVVLALFVDGGSCPDVLDEMQALAPSFPGVRFAGGGAEGRPRQATQADPHAQAVAADRDRQRRGAGGAVQGRDLPAGEFLYPGGEVQGGALLDSPSRALLRRRVATLVRGSRGRGWRGPAR